MITTCRYHCRACGAHFASLEAFDAHNGRTGAGKKPTFRPCQFPNLQPGWEMVARAGECRISDPQTPSAAVSVYGLARPGNDPGKAARALRGS